MLIVAIGWMYVVLMLALAKSTLPAALAVVLFYGLLPLGVILYIAGFPRRARARKQRGAEGRSIDVTGQNAHDPDRDDAEPH